MDHLANATFMCQNYPRPNSGNINQGLPAMGWDQHSRINGYMQLPLDPGPLALSCAKYHEYPKIKNYIRSMDYTPTMTK